GCGDMSHEPAGLHSGQRPACDRAVRVGRRKRALRRRGDRRARVRRRVDHRYHRLRDADHLSGLRPPGRARIAPSSSGARRCFALAERKPAKKGAQTPAESTTAIDKKSKRFTDEERAAMKARARELKAEERASRNRAEGERDVLAAIAAMNGPDRVMAERLHAIIAATAPSLWPKTWYGMPAYAKNGKVVCFFKS